MRGVGLARILSVTDIENAEIRADYSLHVEWLRRLRPQDHVFDTWPVGMPPLVDLYCRAFLSDTFIESFVAPPPEY